MKYIFLQKPQVLDSTASTPTDEDVAELESIRMFAFHRPANIGETDPRSLVF